jgi:hypothetical protein
VDDAPKALAAKSLTDRSGLCAAKRAELKAVEVTVQNLVWILHVCVADQVDAGLGHS